MRIERWCGGRADWAAVVHCVQEVYSPFAVNGTRANQTANRYVDRLRYELGDVEHSDFRFGVTLLDAVG